MSESGPILVDPNLADLEVLQRLPGVGPALAQRILDARPFTGVEDLRRVSGLGEAALTRLAPHLHFAAATTAPEPPPADRTTPEHPPAEAEAPAREPIPEQLRDAASAVTSAASASLRRLGAAFSRSESLWLVLGTGAVSVVLSVLLTLLILAGINGTLSIGRHRVVRQLSTDLGALQRSLESADARLDSVESQLSALEGLSGRMTSVEDQIERLQGEMALTLGQVEAMQSTIDRLDEQAQALAQRADRFDSFLTGLLELLSGLIPSTTAPTPLP